MKTLNQTQQVRHCHVSASAKLTAGYLAGQIQFPAWLGKNSRRGKMDRILAELQTHTRLSAGASKESLAQEYGQLLRNHIVGPLVRAGQDGVDEAVERMGDYALLREDLDGLLEVTQWPHTADPMKNVESKTKAAFTRKYNKEGVALPYSIAQTVSKKKGGGGGGEELLPGEEEELEDEEDNGDDLEKDGMIKKKTKPATTSKKEETTGKGKGKGKTSGVAGKNKAKK